MISVYWVEMRKVDTDMEWISRSLCRLNGQGIKVDAGLSSASVDERRNENENEQELQNMRQRTRCEYRAVIYTAVAVLNNSTTSSGCSSKTDISTDKLSSEHI
jgi:hypothetical protein